MTPYDWFLFVAGVILFLSSSHWQYGRLYDTTAGIERRLQQIFHTLRHPVASWMLTFPMLGIALCVIGIDMQMDPQITRSMKRFMYGVAISAGLVVWWRRRLGDVGFSLTPGWSVGLLGNDTASLHLRNAELKRRECIAIVDALPRLGIRSVIFKSYLLHPNNPNGARFVSLATSLLNQEHWIPHGPPKDSDMNALTRMALWIKITLIHIKEGQLRRLPSALRHMPNQERAIRFVYSPVEKKNAA